LYIDAISSTSTTKNKVFVSEILEMIAEIPNEWQPHKIKNEIAEILSQRIGNKEIFNNAKII